MGSLSWRSLSPCHVSRDIEELLLPGGWVPFLGGINQSSFATIHYVMSVVRVATDENALVRLFEEAIEDFSKCLRRMTYVLLT
jgi:hypothetical protein